MRRVMVRYTVRPEQAERPMRRWVCALSTDEWIAPSRGACDTDLGSTTESASCKSLRRDRGGHKPSCRGGAGVFQRLNRDDRRSQRRRPVGQLCDAARGRLLPLP